MKFLITGNPLAGYLDGGSNLEKKLMNLYELGAGPTGTTFLRRDSF
jgi:hypothetical protein